jgi:hypothetical protein
MKRTSMAAAFVLVGFPALAGAHAGNNDPNMVHACVGNLSRVVRPFSRTPLRIVGSLVRWRDGARGRL